jgi:mevalonate kinase
LIQTERANFNFMSEQAKDPTSAYGHDREINLVETACAKAILVGEHAVVYGARAVAMPVSSMQMQVKMRSWGPAPHVTPTIRVTLGGQKVSEHLRAVVHDAFTVLEITPFSLEIEGHSNLLIGAGLGSSASLCIVVLRAVAKAADVSISREQLAQFGTQLEKRFHGNPSGLDTAVVAMEQVITFVKGQTPQFVNIAPVRTHGHGKVMSWHFALIDSGSRSSTKAMIQIAQPYFQGEEGERRLRAFDALAAEVMAGLTQGKQETVAAGMNEAAIRLDGVGVVSARLREVMAAADAVGVLASKPTGAGGGGCVLTLLDACQAPKQLKALQNKFGPTRVFPVELS